MSGKKKSNHIIPDKDIQMGNREYYVTCGELSFELDDEHKDNDLTAEEMSLLSEDLPEEGPCIHLCCGAGRHAIAFAECGVSSIGIDFSPFLIKQAACETRDKRLEDTLLPLIGEAESIPVKSGTCPMVTLLGNSFTLIPESEARAVFREVSRVLKPGGKFVVDLPDLAEGGRELVRKPVLQKAIETKSLGCGDLLWERTLNPETRTLTSVETFIRQGEEGQRESIRQTVSFRLYEKDELLHMGSLSGLFLAVKKTCRDPTGKYRGMLKQRTFMIFQKSSFL